MDLSDIRREIDGIDEALTALFCRRMRLAADVAAYKREKGLPVLDAAREHAVLARAEALAGEAFAPQTQSLFRHLFSASRAYQLSLMNDESAFARNIRASILDEGAAFPKAGSVACQGERGAYAQLAAEALFEAPGIAFFRSFEAVFSAVEEGLCEYGVLPIENSTYGSVAAVYDLLRERRLHIVRGVKLGIEHKLLANPGASLGEIREVFSHEQALGQCGAFLLAHPHIKATPAQNTAVAARLVSESGRTDIAAISSIQCAAHYGLEVIHPSVQNERNNVTRFICVAKEPAVYPNAGRISLMFTLDHRPGALHEIISRFAALSLNLMKIESRPIPGSDFAFMFYFDLEGSIRSGEVLALLDVLSKENASLSFLGNYEEIAGGEGGVCATG